MQGYCAPFKGKKITLLGLGLLGRGVGDAEFLAKCGADVVAVDRKNEKELAQSVARLERYPNITFHLGTNNREDFTNADMVIKAAGVPLDSAEITAAKKAGVPVFMSTALFAKYAAEAGAAIVGITGTRGKSTITQMIAHSLISAAAQAPADRRANVVVGGNVRGVSTLAQLRDVAAGTIAVLELDSWQLQGFGDLKISPHIAVFTNLMPDHQNYYPSMDAYFDDKANIFRYQSRRPRVGTPTGASGKNQQGAALLVGGSVLERVKAARPKVPPQAPPPIPNSWKLNIIGEHNRENAAFAAAALRALSLPEREIKNGIESFEPVEGRLQFVREIRGVKIYNDNNATTPEATIAALHALTQKGFTKPLLIAGGSDKGLDMSALVAEVKANCKLVFLLAGTGTDRIKRELPGAPMFNNLRDAVAAALAASAPGDTVLFSPAFASFGMFKNEYDRNDQFVRLINEL